MLSLSIVTPQRPFLKERCLSVLVPGKLGEMQVLTGHASCLSEISSGVVTIEKENKEQVRFMVGEGFLEVENDQLNMLVEQAVFQEEIDKDKEQQRFIELTKQTKGLDQSDEKQRMIFAELERSAAKLKLFS